jgi:hypothetical protein
MPGADVIVIDTHYIILNQDQSSPNLVYFEEHVTYNNTGNESYSDRIYIWTPSNIKDPYKPVLDLNGTKFETDQLQPALNFLFINLSVEDVSIQPGETLKVVYKFNLDYKNTNKFTFQRTFLYENKNVIIFIQPSKQYNVKGEEGLQLIYNPETETYATRHGTAFPRDFGESMSISFERDVVQEPKENDDGENVLDTNSLLMLIILIIAICLIIIIYVRSRSSQEKPPSPKTSEVSRRRQTTKRRPKEESVKRPRPSGRKGKETPAKPKPSKLPTQREKLVSEKKKVLKITDKLKTDYKNGVISKATYDKLRLEYKEKLKKTNKRIEKIDKSGEDDIESDDESSQSPELQKLLTKKDRILKAIKKLEDDLDAGEIDEDLFEEMSKAYKKQAVEILKKIDQVREKNL